MLLTGVQIANDFVALGFRQGFNLVVQIDHAVIDVNTNFVKQLGVFLESVLVVDLDAVAEQRKAMEAEREELRRQQDETARLESIRRKRIQDEEEAAQEQEAKRQAAEYTAALAARLEALKPEIEKAHDLAQSMITDAQDSLQRLGNPAWAGDAMHAIRNCGATIIALVTQR